MLRTFQDKLRPYLQSPWLMLPIFIAAALIIIFQAPIEGTVIFVLLVCALLVLSENTAITLLPFSLLCMFVLKEYNSFDRFIKLWWLAIPVIPSLLYHLIAFREKPKKSILPMGIAAVAIAVTFGGLGTISAGEYFTGANLYYVAGLGIGMVFLHYLFSAKFHDRDGFDLKEYLCLVFYLIGIFGVFMLLQHIAANWNLIWETKELPYIQWSNNLSTFLMISLPFGFYYTKKNPLHMISVLLMMVCMLLSGSRAPLIFGVLEYLLCVVVFTVLDRKKWYVYMGPLVIAAAVLLVLHKQVIAYVLKVMHSYDGLEDEPRYKMALRSWQEFKANPLFGSGLGSTSRQDIYNPKKFAMNWYHSAPFQIFGSLGLVGIAAYCFQWYTRVKVFLHRRSLFGWTVMLSFVGLFLMSMVNPGFFCPLPYEFFMVLLFATLANEAPSK